MGREDQRHHISFDANGNRVIAAVKDDGSGEVVDLQAEAATGDLKVTGHMVLDNPSIPSGSIAIQDGVDNTKLATVDASHSLFVKDQNPAVVFSTNNASTAALGGGATFTGTADDLTNYDAITISFFAAPATATGTLYFEFSPDNSHWDVSVPLYVADPTVFIPFPLRVVARYFRVRYVNNSVAQTALRLNVLLHRHEGETLTRTPTQVIGPAEPVKAIRSLMEPGLAPASINGIISADKSIFGSAVVAGRVNQQESDFSASLAANAVITTTTNGGSTAQSNGEATITTGTNTSGTARLQSPGSLVYEPGHEVYCMFTARFTTPTHANSNQRAGLYDDNNGVFLGYAGTTFGFTVRKGASDTFTALTAANGDPVNSSFLSRFARNGQLENLDPTKDNVYRISFGWLGAAPIRYEVLSPDGVWITLHSVRQPNNTTGPSINTPNLPIRMEAAKASADATSLIIGTGSWAAGSVVSGLGLTPSQTHSRTHVDANVRAVTTTTTIYTVTSGRTFYLTGLSMSAINSSVTTNGQYALTDNGTVKLPVIMGQQVTGGSSASSSIAPNLAEPIAFTTNVRLDILAGTITASAMIVGYEAR